MNKKIIIQLILFFFIVLFLSLFYFSYIFQKEAINVDVENKTIVSDIDENSSNKIEDIEYAVNDSVGNKYIIKAKFGRILDDNGDLILMEEVEANIVFNNYEKIIIKSDSAIYNIANYDTNFEDNILIEYQEHEITCNKIDLLFKDHKINLYENINYKNLNTYLLADRMEIDLITKDSKIYMNNKNKKIEVTYKNNGNY
tara:strand:- start:285 stop:881 length:597 start_codon:yes stop_codon:yes gene_type:complete